MASVNNKWQLANNGNFPCINSDDTSPVRILVWVGGKDKNGPVKCDLKLDDLRNGNSFVHIFAENDYVVEEKILYTIECLNKSLAIKENNNFSITEVLYTMPRYNKTSANNIHPLPSFQAWELKSIPNTSIPHEIIKTEYFLDPEIPKSATRDIVVTVQIHPRQT